MVNLYCEGVFVAFENILNTEVSFFQEFGLEGLPVVLLLIERSSCWLIYWARLVPRPSPSFSSLAVRLNGREPGTFSHVNDITNNFAHTHTLECNYSKSKDGITWRWFYVALHKTVGRTESFTKAVQWRHVVLAHVQLKSFYRRSTHDVTHVRKCTRPSPA